MSRTFGQTQKLVTIAVLAAASLIISFFSFPIIPAAPFLKMDFADIPILLATFSYGPLAGIGTAFIRSCLHYILTAGEGGLPIGDFAAFVASVSFSLPIYYTFKRFGFTFKGRLLGMIAASGSLTLALSFLNTFVLLPLYQWVMDFSIESIQAYLVGAVIPFNLLKGMSVSLVFFLLYRLLRPWLLKKIACSQS